MKLLNSIALCAISFCAIATSVVGNPIILILDDVVLLNSFEAQVDEIFLNGEISGIPYSAFSKEELYPSVTSQGGLYQHLVDNKKSLELTVEYNDSPISTRNIEPTYVKGKSLFGFKFQLTSFPYGKIVLQGNVNYTGYFKISTSQLLFFDKVNEKTDLEALQKDLKGREVLAVQFSGLSTSNPKKSAIATKTINTTQGSCLFVSIAREVNVSSPTGKVSKTAYLNLTENSLEIETSTSETLQEGIMNSPWLTYKFTNEFPTYRIIPTSSISTKPDGPNGNFKLTQKFNPTVSQCFPKTDGGSSTEKGDEILFSTHDSKSKSLAFFYENTKQIEIYTNMDIGTLQGYIGNSLFGYCLNKQGKWTTVIPGNNDFIHLTEDSKYNYFKYSFEETVSVFTGTQTVVGKLAAEEMIELYGSEDTLKNVKSAAETNENWTVTTPNNVMKIRIGPLSSSILSIKDMSYINVSFKKLS